MRMLGLLGVVLLLVLGCSSKKEKAQEKLKSDLEPIIAKHSTQTKAVLATIPEVGKTAVAAPKVTARQPVSRSFTFDPGNPLNGGTLIETAQILVNRVAKAEINIEEDLYTKRLNQIMDGTYKGTSTSAKQLETDFARVTGIKQIAAVRFHEVVKPQLSGEKSFVKGHARGDVLIYDIDTKKQIGAFPFDASGGDDSVAVKKKNAQGGLEHKFHESVKKAIFEEFVAYLANRPGPATPGREPEKPAEKPADKAGEGSDKPAEPADKKADDTKPNDKKKWPTNDKKPADKAGGGW